MAKTKLMHIISDTNIGGAGRYLLTFLSEVNRDRFDVSVVLPRGSKLLVEVENLGANAIEIDGMSDLSFSHRGISQIKKVCRNEKPNIVHTHGALSGRIGAKLAKVPVVTYTRHSVFNPPAHLRGGAGFWVNRALNKWTSKRIIAVAKAAAQNLIDSGVDEKQIDVIYNGVPPLKTRTAEQNAEFLKSIGAKPNIPTLAIAARLTAVKGQRYIIEAAKILKEKGIAVQIIIAGTGEDAEMLNELAEEVGGSVIMAGFLKDIEGLMNAMDIQLNASFGTEAASLSLLEGMSLGKPAIVTDYGGNPELIKDGENGLIVPQKDAAAMAAAIEKLLGDKELYNNMHTNAKKTYEKRFTAKIMTDNMQKFYGKLTEMN